MKTIASQALVPEITWKREALGQLRHATVESGVKAGDLCEAGKACGHSLDDLDLTGEVKWSIGDESSEPAQESCVNPLRC
jgi:predicted carbohydrate-binding protein with CBM5 and CBM33 domain